ncbi:MAG: hypothetical protein CSA65_05665 [Proteobacteria bacterium]|nr:MAG: hypothetical protein CSB49_01995 [Pseudomonadota bacterium]PIE18205.1 MAG: hypothetical protein CSA65_05665 [Pseudomonadota bacterium]
MSRFGLKIIGAMLLLAVIPLVTSIWLVAQVIEVSNNVAAGQVQQLAEPVSRSASAYRALFRALKAKLKLQGQLIGGDSTLRALLAGAGGERPAALRKRAAALLAAHRDLASLRVATGDGRELVKVARSFDPQRMRDLRVTHPIGDKARLELVFVTPRAPFDDFRALGRAQRDAVDVGKLRGELESLYRMVFLIIFGAVVLVAMVMGLLIARRTTRRISRLVGATREVAAGHLDTQVRLESRDEVRELGEAFNEMVRELRDSRGRIAYLEKIGAWQEIARRLAHEIKNPLTPIQLAAQQLHRQFAGDDPAFRRTLDDAYDIITEEVDGLRRLVTAFSSFAKLPRVQAGAVELHNLIDDFLKSHVELSEQAEIRYTPLDNECLVLVDRMLLKHVLVNLIENAIQAGAEAGLERTIAVELTASIDEPRREVLLTIADDGPGMDPETVSRAFDPYYTTKEHGTGLGLAIVKKIVLEHQGSIELSSTPGEGTRFSLRLPLEVHVDATTGQLTRLSRR